jgi:PPOX class probable FMN-dependent enzyme
VTPDWLNLLREALAREFPSGPVTATLATAKGGMAFARTVVVRRVDDAGHVWFTTDARSEKYEQLADTPAAELVFWLGGQRRQFRVRGPVRTVGGDDPAGARTWREMSDAARALFFWPDPGERRSPGAAFVDAVGKETAPPEQYAAVAVLPNVVEELDVGSHPHRRRRWCEARGWVGEELNP